MYLELDSVDKTDRESIIIALVKSGYMVGSDKNGNIQIIKHMGKSLEPRRMGCYQFVCNCCSREINIKDSTEAIQRIENGDTLFYIVCKKCRSHYKLNIVLKIEETKAVCDCTEYIL